MSFPLSLSTVRRPQAGWYRGDFHAHSNVSLDGHHPPDELAEVARAEGLDFLAITDHNAVGAFGQFQRAPAVLVIPGVEVTLTEGHFNVFGFEGRLGWMEHICTGEGTIGLPDRYHTTTDLMRQISAHGLLSSVNHPLLQPWEWRDEATALSCVDCLEIWNDPPYVDNARANPEAVLLWTELLNAGYRITAIGGSDYHGPAFGGEKYQSAQHMGVPSTYVYAEELSGTAILSGLALRRVYVSMGPQVTFRAWMGGRTYDIGADVGAVSGNIQFAATVEDSPMPASARIVKNGQVVASVSVKAGRAALEYSDTTDPTRSDWYRLDVLDHQGLMLAITNPIFVGRRRKPECSTYGAFVDLGSLGAPQLRSWRMGSQEVLSPDDDLH